MKDDNVSTADAVCGQLKGKGSTIAARMKDAMVMDQEKFDDLIINCELNNYAKPIPFSPSTKTGMYFMDECLIVLSTENI